MATEEQKTETPAEAKTEAPAEKKGKKSILKIALYVIGGLIALFLIAVIANPLWIGPLVKCTANSVVPSMTGCEFKMEACSINLWTGKIFLGKTHLANPKGYDNTNAVAFDSVNVDLDIGTVLSKKIHVRDITVESPYVSYVFDDAGSNNFDRIIAAVTGGEKKEAPKAEEAKKDEAKKSSGPKVVIDRLAINGTKVKYRMITLPIPLPTLTNIGGGDDDDGATVEEVSETVWQQAKDKITGIGGLATDGAKQLGNAAADGVKAVGNVAADGAKAATEGAKAVGTAAADGVKAAGSVAADGAKAVGEGAKKAADAAAEGAKAVGEGLKKLNPFGK